jgi:hypothetical protein
MAWLAFQKAGVFPRFAECFFWALAARLAGLFAEPILEDDHFRYLWDGYIFATTGNPYLTSPMEWFGTDGVDAPYDWFLSNINHPEISTIYGPGAQMLFLLNQLLGGGSLVPLKMMIIIADLVAGWFIYRQAGSKASALFLMCPLLIKEGSINGHFDSIAIALMLAALSLKPSERGRLLALGLLAFASSIRPFAILMLPILLLKPRLEGALRKQLVSQFPRIAVEGIVFSLILLLLYLPFGLHVAGGSTLIFGKNWEFNSSLYALFALALDGGSSRILVGSLFVILAAALYLHYLRWGARRLPKIGVYLFGGLLILSPVANAWYALWLLPFAAMHRVGWAWTLLVMISLSYITEGNLGNGATYSHPLWVRPLEFTPVLFAALLGWWKRFRGG